MREALLEEYPGNMIVTLSGSAKIYTAISRKVVGRNVHPAIPKGNGYEQCTVPDTIALEPILLMVSFSRFANILPWPLVPFFQISPEEQ